MGTSYIYRKQCSFCRDHPHAYGDKSVTGIEDYTVPGSSPRVWGQASGNCKRSVNGGIIPTRMGTRKRKSPERIRAWDHPHAYGDKGRFRWKILNVLGSSPRVWGQVDININITNGIGIIPTRMGTRNNISIDKFADEDHPHAYGDKDALICGQLR